MVQHSAWRKRKPNTPPYHGFRIEDAIVSPVVAAALAATAANERKMTAPPTHSMAPDG